MVSLTISRRACVKGFSAGAGEASMAGRTATVGDAGGVGAGVGGAAQPPVSRPKHTITFEMRAKTIV
jgi:hypothetical protein